MKVRKQGINCTLSYAFFCQIYFFVDFEKRKRNLKIKFQSFYVDLVLSLFQSFHSETSLAFLKQNFWALFKTELFKT